MGEFHGLGAGGAVVGDDHQHVDALREQAFHVLDLPSVVAVRGLHEDLGAERAGAFDEHLAVGLPALFLQRIHGEPDPRARLFRSGGHRTVPAGEDEAGGEAQEAGEQDEGDAQFHRGEDGGAAAEAKHHPSEPEEDLAKRGPRRKTRVKLWARTFAYPSGSDGLRTLDRARRERHFPGVSRPPGLREKCKLIIFV